MSEDPYAFASPLRDIDAEKRIFGCLFKDPVEAFRQFNGLDPRHFADPFHAHAFLAASQIHSSGSLPTIKAIFEWMRHDDHSLGLSVEQIGARLQELAGEPGLPEQAGLASHRVSDLAIRRALADQLETAAQELRHNPGARPAEIMAEISASVPLASHLDPSKLCLTPAQWAEREIPPADLLLGSLFSTTTRTQFSADTGLGKTMFGLARSYAIRLGVNFLRWEAHRPGRVLYLDGEMPAELIKERLAMAASWFGTDPVSDGFYLLSREDVEGMPPLDTPEGARWILDFMEKHCGGHVDDCTLDNIAPLTIGSLKEEDGARNLNDLQRQLTKQKTGQNWLHHTGHDTTRGYGAKLREWHLDTTMVGERLERPSADVAMTLKFPKCRRRTPANRDDYQTINLVLEQGLWTTSTDIGGEDPEPKTVPAKLCRDALMKALAEFGDKPPWPVLRPAVA